MAAVTADLSRRVAECLTAAGMPEDDPFRAAMILTVEAAQAAREAVQSGARGLSPEGEAEMILRIHQRNDERLVS